MHCQNKMKILKYFFLHNLIVGRNNISFFLQLHNSFLIFLLIIRTQIFNMKTFILFILSVMLCFFE